MKGKRIVALVLTLCLMTVFSFTAYAFQVAEPVEETMEAVNDMAATAEGESQDAESSGEPGGESTGEPGGESTGEPGGESAGGGGDASGMPDTTMGGKATSRPPDNSTKAIDILGTRAAIYIEYAEDGYTVSNNISDAYTVEGADIAVPVIGTENVISGLHIECDRIDWDAENAVGNSGIIINALQDTETTFAIGGEESLYDAPNGEKYNSVIIMKVDDDEEYDTSATETAPGCGIAINGKSLLLKNVYVESSGKGRPSIHVPASTRDKNVKQLSDLICVDSYIVNHSTRALLLMGGDVWFLHSKGITDSWGALSYDNTSTTMYVVNSLAENNGTAYAIYDAAGCTAYIYGSKIVSGGTGITVCRTATLTTASLDEADETATAPYNGAANLMTPAATEDGKTIVVGYYYPIKIHADMSGADSVASAYLKDTYLSSQLEDVVLYDGTDFVPPDTVSGRAGSEAMNTLVNEYTTGMIVELACHNGKVVFDNCVLNSRKGELVHSFFTYDSMASGIYPIDGVEYIGDEIVFRNMSAKGDVIHEDYMRKMAVSLENTELTGTVTGTTLTGWNHYWREQMESIDSEEGDEILVIHDETYETVWGVRMSMDASSVWNVAGTSQLYSFTAEEGAVIRPAEGKTMTIYVDCTMDNGLEVYDTAAGTQIDTFEPGAEYSGVVIVVEAAASEGESPEGGSPEGESPEEGAPAAEIPESGMVEVDTYSEMAGDITVYVYYDTVDGQRVITDLIDKEGDFSIIDMVPDINEFYALMEEALAN